MKIVKYALISRFDSETLEREVNCLLEEGWVLYGNPVMIPVNAQGYSTHTPIRSDAFVLFCQGMVLYGKEKSGVEKPGEDKTPKLGIMV